ncbi:glycoside hydrolase family 18 [Pseudobacteroides cellulosolvens ATCC 35603 = DSM 2933]|uniref:chitinase n=2 Tax=Pseudobacteroides cellulosolvens TaxID=35825 RepID=A0A0L6JMZ4_9FIRM|nr:glycoside hydrolase family 18 [Pseudobacteroides cellulosolvens ATCC 35603 = DSM 2933]
MNILHGKLLKALCIIVSMVMLNTSIVMAEDEGPKNIVAYFTEWGIYEGHNFYEVSDMPWDKLTHINYAFAKIENGKIALCDPWAAIDKPFGDDKWDTPLKGNLGQLIKYKKLYPKVKTLISVGGWTQSMYFSDVALTDSSRQVFSDSCVEFIRKYQFDGVDIDWEFPVAGGLAGNKCRPEDKQNFTLLLKGLRTKLDEAGIKDGKKYLLTIAAPAGSTAIANTEPDKYHQYLDFINLMTYDYNGSWSNMTNHLSPLYENPDDPSYDAAKQKNNTNWTVSEYIKLGVPAQKLNMGVPFYSTGWKDVNGGSNGLFGNANGSPVGIWNESSSPGGTNPYYYIKDVLEAPGSGFTKYWDNNSQVPYLWNPSTKVFYTYEDEVSLKNKCEYAKKNNLGGIMFWEICGDHPSEEKSLVSVIYNSFSKKDPKPTPTVIPTDKPSYKISGYVRPDFNFTKDSEARVLSGFKIELSYNGIKTTTDANGYYEVSGVPASDTPYTLTLTKPGYLTRQIKSVLVNNNVKLGTKESPLDMCAGDVGTKGVQDNVINMSDIIEIAKVFGSVSGDGKYNSDCDFNMDYSINMSDVIIIARHFNMSSDDYK